MGAHLNVQQWFCISLVLARVCDKSVLRMESEISKVSGMKGKEENLQLLRINNLPRGGEENKVSVKFLPTTLPVGRFRFYKFSQ